MQRISMLEYVGVVRRTTPSFGIRASFGAPVPNKAFKSRLRGLLQISVLLLSVSLLTSTRADDASYWESSLAKVKVMYLVKNDRATGFKDGSYEEIHSLRTNMVQRLKDSPSFAQLVRTSLRNDARVWVRVFAATILIEAFEHDGAADEIYILSDPDIDVRAFAILGIGAYKIQDAACSLPAGLLSKSPAERLTAVRGIRKLLGWKGLPYYAHLLYDSDAEVASEAAIAFRSCNREDAVPHLLRYLRQCGKSPRKTPITRSVIETLGELYGEPVSGEFNLKNAVENWTKRLCKQPSN
jgi:hypothetical protein